VLWGLDLELGVLVARFTMFLQLLREINHCFLVSEFRIQGSGERREPAARFRVHISSGQPSDQNPISHQQVRVSSAQLS